MGVQFFVTNLFGHTHTKGYVTLQVTKIILLNSVSFLFEWYLGQHQLMGDNFDSMNYLTSSENHLVSSV